VARSPARGAAAPARVARPLRVRAKRGPDEWPLAFNQERRLFLENALRTRRIPFLPFFIASGSNISGPVSVAALEDALNAVVARHGALRAAVSASRVVPAAERKAAFESYGRTGVCRSGIHAQTLRDPTTVVLRRRMLAADPEGQDVEIASVVDEACAEEFDLAAAPLMRALLLTRGANDHLLVVVCHHLFADGLSMQVFRGELQRAYARLLARGAEADETPFSYERFAALQHAQEQEGAFKPALEYWARQWARFEGTQWNARDLPFSAVPSPTTMNTAAQTLSLGPTLASALKARARECGATLFVFCLAACALWLHRLTGRTPIPIWTNFANRAPLTDRTIGWLANTHLVGIELDDDPTGRQLVERTRRTVLDATTAQELPLPLLWRAIGTSLIRGIGIAFEFETETQKRWQGAPPPVAVKRALLPGSRRATVHLQITGRVEGDDISFRIWHSTDLCTSDDAGRLLAALRKTIVMLTNDPGSRASSLRLSEGSSG
jgi:hypothetical protein